MKRLGLLLLLAVLAVACGGRGMAPAIPAPVDSTTVGIGDVFEVHILGEGNLPAGYTVAPDGTADLPYIHRIQVAGLEPQELAELIRSRLVQDKILSNPSVTVNIKTYNSKKIELIGELQKPGSIPLEPGMTLLRAISMAGGFTPMADQGRVSIRRKMPRDKNQTEQKVSTFVVSVEQILGSGAPDVPLQAGDSVNVPQRSF